MALIQPVILVGNNIVPAGTGQYIDPTSLGSGSPTSSTFLTGANTWVTIPYDIVGGSTGSPFPNAILLTFVTVRSLFFATNLTGSYCTAGIAATASTTLTLNKNGTSFGTVTFAATWTTIPYDIVGGASSLLTSGEKILNFVAVRPFSLAANVSGSYCVAITAPTSTAVFYLNKNGSSFGSMLFPSASTSATFSSTATSFLIGDILSVEAPSPADSTLANVGFTLMGIV